MPTGAPTITGKMDIYSSGQTKNNIYCPSRGTQYTNYLKKQRLGQINSLAAMMLTPTRKNAPTAALEIIHELIPLELALQETTINAYHTLKLITQASWTNNKVKKTSLIPHLKFLKNTYAQAAGLRQDAETIIENIEDKNYWIMINNKKGKTKPIPSQHLCTQMGVKPSKELAPDMLY